MSNFQSRKTTQTKKLTALLLAFLFTLTPLASAQESITTIYPSKYYNIDSNGKVTKHIFANGIEIAVIEGTGIDAKVKYIHTDNLGGTNVVTDSNGVVVETIDYYPYGNIRIDEKTSSSEQRKYIGEEYDESTKLNYLNARYYDSSTGKFISQDPVFWEIGMKKNQPSQKNNEIDQTAILSDPQLLNSYSYSANNPITKSDPDGRCLPVCAGALAIPGVKEVIIGGIVVVGSYLVHEASKVFVESVKGWGSRTVPEPYRTVNEKTSGLNQSPMGPEDWEPKNLPNLPKWSGYLVGGGIIATIIKDTVHDQPKDQLEFTKEFKEKTKIENIPQTNNKNQKSEQFLNSQKSPLKTKK